MAVQVSLALPLTADLRSRWFLLYRLVRVCEVILNVWKADAALLDVLEYVVELLGLQTYA